MTPSERRIMELIRANPYVTQQEIANTLGIARSSVAVHISHMINKGDILGRGYLLPDDKDTSPIYVTVVGGANVDIVGAASDHLIPEDSNPGQVTMLPGGVGRNIAYNLSMMNVMTEFITPLGGDESSNIIRKDGNRFFSMEHSIVFLDEATSTYLVILDEQGEMVVSVNDMKIMNKLTPHILKDMMEVINDSKVAVYDTNLTEETLAFLLKNTETLKVVDAVSGVKAKKLKGLLSYIDVLKVNHHEAEVLAELSVVDHQSLIEAGKKLMGEGVATLIITYGKEGSYLFQEDEIIKYTSTPLQIVNATGAGDAFTALIIHGMVRNIPMKEAMVNATAGARIMLKSMDSSGNVTDEKLLEEKKEVSYENI